MLWANVAVDNDCILCSSLSCVLESQDLEMTSETGGWDDIWYKKLRWPLRHEVGMTSETKKLGWHLIQEVEMTSETWYIKDKFEMTFETRAHDDS